MSERHHRIATGLATLLFIFSASTLGVRAATGAFDDVYQVKGVFSSAGQGLIQDSDVKIHGVNIGRVAGVELENGRALVTMDIESGERIPVDASATIRPKTLFGEKFVDIAPGPNEFRGPFLADDDFIEDTTGGFELEQILSELHPVLEAVRPEHLSTVLDTLATAGEGLGPTINRTIVNFGQLADVQARHAVDTQQFLSDLALLSEELAIRADDLVGAARDLNVALPPLNEQGDELRVFLEQAARLSHDVADILEANRPFMEKAVTQGGKTLQTLYEERQQIVPLVVGLRQFIQLLAEVTRIPLGDGTNMAAVKWIFGEECPQGQGLGTCAPEDESPSQAGPASAGGPGPVPLPGGGGLGLALPEFQVSETVRGAEAVVGMVRDLLR